MTSVISDVAYGSVRKKAFRLVVAAQLLIFVALALIGGVFGLLWVAFVAATVAVVVWGYSAHVDVPHPELPGLPSQARRCAENPWHPEYYGPVCRVCEQMARRARRGAHEL